MLKKEIRSLITAAQPNGWVLEPDAKRILEITGIRVPRFHVAHDVPQATEIADSIGYPVVAKIVSPKVLHKTEVDGVVVGIQNADELRDVFNRFSQHCGFAGMLVEETVAGHELIVGGKIDAQFGPVVLLGMGGTGVEIYKDTSLRMAPIQKNDVISMVDGLQAGELLKGFRGDAGIDMDALIGLIVAFSDLLMAIAHEISSVDLNPVFCSSSGCVVADARIVLKSKEISGQNTQKKKAP